MTETFALAVTVCVLGTALALVSIVLVLRWPKVGPDHVRGLARGMAEAFEKGRAVGNRQSREDTEPMTDFTEEMRTREPLEEPPVDEPVDAGSYRC